MRKTLQEYNGEVVTVRAEYCKYNKTQGKEGKLNNINLGRPYVETFEVVDSKVQCLYKQQNVDENYNVTQKDIDKVIQNNHLIKPIAFINNASCITNIEGIGGFLNIKEQHVNIQENLYNALSSEQKKKYDEGDVLTIEFDAKVYKYIKNQNEDYALEPLSKIIVIN